MLKLLLRLWADQKRRDFKWGRFFGQLYFFVLFFIISTAVTVAVHDETGDIENVAGVVSFIAVSIIVPDFLHK